MMTVIFVCDCRDGKEDYKKYDIILNAVFESIYRNFTFTEEQMDAFIADFVLGLPYYLQVSLAKAA